MSPDLLTTLLVLAPFAALGLGVYLRIARGILSGGARVDTGEFQPPDLAVALGLSTWFGWLVYGSLGLSEPREINPEDMVRGAVLFLFIIFLLLGFLHSRGRDLIRIFGLRNQRPLPALGRALGLLAAAMPMVIFAGLSVHMLRGGVDEPQEIIKFFQDKVRESDLGAVFQTVGFGVILAPIAEETIFRGYLYGVFKRFGGILPAMGIDALLFAAIHLNAASFPGLVILALCLLIAYEWTGSLLVPILMHALFNLGNLVILFAHARALQS